jgi:arginine repressor
MLKSKANKTRAVRDYLFAHPEAKSGEIAAALKKQGITIKATHVSNIKTKLNAKGVTQPLATEVVVLAPAVVEKPMKNGDTLTLEQVKKVAQTVKSLGGFNRVTEVLEVIKGLGGVKKFKDLAEAIMVTDVES